MSLLLVLVKWAYQASTYLVVHKIVLSFVRLALESQYLGDPPVNLRKEYTGISTTEKESTGYAYVKSAGDCENLWCASEKFCPPLRRRNILLIGGDHIFGLWFAKTDNLRSTC